MAKHKPLCLIVNLLVIIGALNWGLVGLGMLIGNATLSAGLVSLILGFSPILVGIVYLLVGVAGVAMIAFTMKCKECACEKMDNKMEK